MRKIDRGKNVTLKKNKDYHLVYSAKPLLNNLIKKDLGEDRLLTFFKTMFVRTFFPQKKDFTEVGALWFSCYSKFCHL